MDIKKYTEANRTAWNEVTPIHQKARRINLKEKFKEKGFSTLDELVTSKLKEIPIKGKIIAQLCCNNGSETLSLVNLGAASGVGFDISDEAIAEADELAGISGLNCRFVRTDVYDIGKEYYDSYDLIYVSIGALPWLPDLDGFINLISKMLRKNGILFIYEEHPFIYMLATKDEKEFDSKNPLKITYPYFKKDPWVNDTGIDYIGKSSYKSETNYCFSHTLSEIISGVVKNDISITEFTEYPHNINSEFEHIENENMLPLCYILIGRKV